jgi:hypothetical protein
MEDAVTRIEKVKVDFSMKSFPLVLFEIRKGFCLF